MRRNCCKQKEPPIFKICKFIILFLIIYLILTFLYQNSSLFYRKTVNLPFSLHLNKKDIYMIKGEETHLYVFGFHKRVNYYSTDFKVAGVNFNGRVFAYRTGKAYIIAKVNKKVLKCRVHVIDISKEVLELKKGERYNLNINGTGSIASWRSNNKRVASVNIFGRVTAKSRGKAIITARVNKRILKCTVYVR